jgi:metal-dependent amidase/aminoacylase/carboxypeptidase family protein
MILTQIYNFVKLHLKIIDKCAKIYAMISFNVNDCLSLIKTVRRDLHQIPELAHDEFKTQAYITDFLKKYGVDFYIVGTAVVADIKGKNPRKTVALRADMDALKLLEANECAYKSKNTGYMHACGHDGHMATLLTTVFILTKCPPDNDVRCIFQPAEESDGGAFELIKKGVLEGVSEIYAFHLDPTLRQNSIATNYGAIMAGTTEFDIFIYGVAAHAANKRAGIDALSATAGLVGALNKLSPVNESNWRLEDDGLFENAAPKVNAKDIRNSTLLHVGKMTAGSGRNIVADKGWLECTIRYFDGGKRDALLKEITKELAALKKTVGVKCELVIKSAYPCLKNSDKCVDRVRALRIRGIDVVAARPRYTAEDFAAYLEKVPGCFMWLGVRDEKLPRQLHGDNFDFDEGALLYGVEIFLELVNA